MILCLGGLLAPLIGSCLYFWGGATEGLETTGTLNGYELCGIISLVIWPFAAFNLMFHSGHIVPGAMDNLAGISILTGLALMLKEKRFHNTEVVLLATSTEEPGLRGAKRFAAAHSHFYRSTSRHTTTRGIFVDGIYDERHLTVVTRELTTTAGHCPQLIDLVVDCARKLNFPIRKAIIPFGGTDASAFSLAGIPSVAILCQDTSQLVHNYHTRDDTQELVRPSSLSTTLALVYKMIETIDKQSESSS